MGEDVTVKILKATADWIQSRPMFNILYHDLNDFVDAAVREKIERWIGPSDSRKP